MRLRGVVLALATALAACATAPPALELVPADPVFALDLDRPGRLAVIWHKGGADEARDRRLVLYGAGGPRELRIAQPVEVRWLGPDELLVATDVASADPAELPRTKLWRVTVQGPARALGEPRRYFNVEPSPDHQRLAVGVETSDAGDSDLEVWELGSEAPRLLHRRAENLDEPRWSPQSDGLVVATMVESNAESGFGLSVGAMSVPFPRLFALDPSLAGPGVAVHDGPWEDPGAPAIGGSLPLWWDERGIYVRQRRGLVRCSSPESGCELVFVPPKPLRIVDGRPGGDGRAYVLLADPRREDGGALGSELWSVALEGGRSLRLAGPKPDAFALDLDWTPALE